MRILLSFDFLSILGLSLTKGENAGFCQLTCDQNSIFKRKIHVIQFMGLYGSNGESQDSEVLLQAKRVTLYLIPLIFLHDSTSYQ